MVSILGRLRDMCLSSVCQWEKKGLHYNQPLCQGAPGQSLAVQGNQNSTVVTKPCCQISERLVTSSTASPRSKSRVPPVYKVGSIPRGDGTWKKLNRDGLPLGTVFGEVLSPAATRTSSGLDTQTLPGFCSFLCS